MLALSALVAFGLAGPPAAAVPPAAGSRGPSCVALEVASLQDTSRQGRVPEFSASTIIDVRFTVLLRGVVDHGLLKLKVFTPQGYLYQTLSVPFAAGPGAVPQARHVDGSSRSVLEQRAAPAAAGADYRVEARLPVAGTLIVSEGLFGRWTVEPWLDGASAACRAGRPFVINP
jgi:hypothetical protein